MGRALCKDEQVSNWEAVELTANQLRYAALDAHCLLGLLDNTVQRFKELHVRDTNNVSDDESVWPDVGVRGMYSPAAVRSVSTDNEHDAKGEAMSNTEEAVDVGGSGAVSAGAVRESQDLGSHGLTKMPPFRIALFVKNIPN